MDDYSVYEEDKSQDKEFKENININASKKLVNNKGHSKKQSDIKFELGKTYWINMDGTILEGKCDAERQEGLCVFRDRDCCALKIPPGFVVHSDAYFSFCYDKSNLKCIKTPVMGKVKLPLCRPDEITECDVVAGYALKIVGSMTFAVSLPVIPVSGVCLTGPTHVSCFVVMPVDSVMAYTCSPNPCPNNYCYGGTIEFLLEPPVSPCDNIYMAHFNVDFRNFGVCV